jgi:hypothetical protein
MACLIFSDPSFSFLLPKVLQFAVVEIVPILAILVGIASKSGFPEVQVSLLIASILSMEVAIVASLEHVACVFWSDILGHLPSSKSRDICVLLFNSQSASCM